MTREDEEAIGETHTAAGGDEAFAGLDTVKEDSGEGLSTRLGSTSTLAFSFCLLQPELEEKIKSL